MILSDFDIRRFGEAGMIQPWDPQLVNPASLDVTLGGTLLIEQEASSDLIEHSLDDYSSEEPYLLQPGHFVLAQTEQFFNMPVDLAALFFLKSSRARSGLEHLHAGFADPGWNRSVLTMELYNSRRLHSIPLYRGMRIGQMVFFKMASTPLADYSVTGRYNGNPTAQPAFLTP